MKDMWTGRNYVIKIRKQIYIGLLKKVLIMCFSICCWTEKNLSEMFTFVNPKAEKFLNLKK